MLVMVGVVALALAVRDVPLGLHLARIERERVLTRLERDAYVLAGRFSEPASDGLTPAEAASELSEYPQRGSTTVVVIDGDGRLLAGTTGDVAIGESYLNRPEIVAGLLGRFESGRRDSVTLGEPVVYATVPVFVDGTAVAVVRLTNPASVIDEQVSRQIRGLVLGALVSVVIGVAAALLMANLLTRPIVALVGATRRFGADASDTSVPEEGPPELRQLARSFNEMKDRVRRMLDQQRSFTGDAAHQLRTPLTALQLRLESAADSLRDSPETAVEHVEAAIQESQRLADLTEQMLLLARSEGRSLPSSRFDLVDLVQEIAGEWSALAAESRIRLEVDAPPSLVIDSSRVAWREILGNYVDNAIGHGSQGSLVRLIVLGEPDHASVTVRDRGPGMGEDERHRAFDRFWRGASTANTEGSGLGLAIVRQLAAAARLTTELREAPGGGLDAVVRMDSRTTA